MGAVHVIPYDGDQMPYGIDFFEFTIDVPTPMATGTLSMTQGGTDDMLVATTTPRSKVLVPYPLADT